MSDPVVSIRDRVGRVLYLVLALSTVGVLVSGVVEASAAGPDTARVQWWRTLAYLVFIAIFLLLAARPRSVPGLWEVVLVQKAGIALVGFIDAAAAEADRSVVDLGVAVVMVVAWILCRGWTSWTHRAHQPEFEGEAVRLAV